MRLAEPGEEDAQVVVDLGDRADGRARALARRLLLDADGRREAGDLLDLRLLQGGEELAGVAGEALDVPPLPLGIERVDRQRALARAARPAADGHLVAGDVDVDPLEVVLAGPPDRDRRQPVLRRRPAVLARLLRAPGLLRDAGLPGEDAPEGLAGVALGDRGHLLGRPLGDDPAAAVAPFGAEVDDPVGGLDHVEVVLDDDDRVARAREAVEDLEQLADVLEVEAGGRLVEDVERLARARAGPARGPA